MRIYCKLLIFTVLTLFIFSCHSPASKNSNNKNELIIFHAGSLSKPVKEITEAFAIENPDILVKTEAAGSVECARKITELDKSCDIIITSDYKVITKLLIPENTGWYLKFASNEMCIAFTDKSRMGNRINSNNWPEILMNDSVLFGRSNPNLDPCGYRTLLSFKLAENYYKQTGLAAALENKDQRYIRPKEVDLLALLETHALDYIFIYRSVAMQHGLKFITLADDINLKNPDYSEYYASVSVEIAGKEKGQHMILKGEPMVYGISILDNSPNPDAALAFTNFLLNPEKGMKIMEQNGQPSVVPSISEFYETIPDQLKDFAIN